MFREEELTPRDLRIIRKRVRLGEVEEESTAADLVTKGPVMKKRKVAKNLRAYTSGSSPSSHRQKPAIAPFSTSAGFILSYRDCELQGFREVENIGQEEIQAMTKSLQTENAKLKHENRLSNTKFETLVAELAKLEVSLQNANALTAKFRDQITTLEAQNRELRDNLQGGSRAEVRSIQEQLLTLHIENTRFQRDNKQILQKNVEVQAELQQAQAHNIEVQPNIELSSQGAIKDTNGENSLFVRQKARRRIVKVQQDDSRLGKCTIQSEIGTRRRKQRDEVAKRAKVAEAKLDNWMWRMTEMTTSLYNDDPSH
ncbi:hypothetical protein PILCRDRAFT_90871 [Piloderma croceum F 1598]|uniref:Uncharacterized protein n=1 Tax=Piloderma croceum (strain F 1598) TaxID=765440 RepID=A0A0C3FDG0_PILCF|nr:hypothetical protein PILCRDRAFT_90871 [Piloderma croceum F 1598]